MLIEIELKKGWCSFGAGIVALMCLGPLPSFAQNDSKAALMADFKSFYTRCPGPASAYPSSCAKESARLDRRARTLHLTNAELKLAKGTQLKPKSENKPVDGFR